MEALRQYEVLKRDGNFIESFSLMNSERKITGKIPLWRETATVQAQTFTDTPPRGFLTPHPAPHDPPPPPKESEFCSKSTSTEQGTK